MYSSLQMRQKHKFFILGMTLGVVIPLTEFGITNNRLDVYSIYAAAIVIGGAIWHYIFLYMVLLNALIVYVKKLRDRIHPDSKVVFLTSGIAFGFSILAIISTTIERFG